MVGVRRRARALALQILYEVDSAGHTVDNVLNRILAEETLPEENASFVRELVTGVIQNKEKLDANIKNFAPAWPVEQIPVVFSDLQYSKF